MSVNEGNLDRAARVILGIQLITLGVSGSVRDAAGILVILAGMVGVVTGISGHCLIYRWLGWSTLPKSQRG
jgi:hypothetical protein